MPEIPVILVFDVGKTNKKLLLFDEQYGLVLEESRQFDEIQDEDGFACEDLAALSAWIKKSFARITEDKRFDIKAVNFSGYGASFVYLNEEGNVFLPLYNYLKPYPESLHHQFYNSYGGESVLARETASPVLGSLNSGLQLYRLKNEKAYEFRKIRYALHLPQYLSYLLSSKLTTDITSIGCHTHLWNFEKNQYHSWVGQEGILSKLAPLTNCESVVGYAGKEIPVGIGLHDSSSALIPYISSIHQPFVLLSTGTWCISLNPFNNIPLTDFELKHDCLCYLSYRGNPVKASRLFAGHEHEQQTKKLSAHFLKSHDFYTSIQYDPELLRNMNERSGIQSGGSLANMLQPSDFGKRKLDEFRDYEEAYHQLIADIVIQQIQSTQLVLNGTSVKKIFVDGGFSKNRLYMHLLAEALPGMEVYAASVSQASALGAGMAIHKHWNTKPFPADIIELNRYVSTYVTSS
jgi:sugar (pentulose or hexulose) kinase